MVEVVARGLRPDEIDYVIYHGGGCADGFTSRVIAQTFLGTEKVTYFGTSHGQDPPKDIEGKNLLIVDFSYPKPVLDKLLTKVKGLLILDHHRSAQKDLESLPDHYKVFNMKESGASLTWRYFYPKEKLPYFVQLIKEHDTWINDAPLFREFSALLPIIPQTFEEYKKFNLCDQDSVTHYVLRESPNLLKMMDVQIEWAVDHAWIYFQRINKVYYLVATVNTTVYPSEVAAALVRKYPIVDFAAVYSVTKTGETRFSLRSTDVQADTIPVAKFYGGGGHRNATGLSVATPVHQLPCPTVDIDLECFKTMKTLVFKDQHYISIYCSENKRRIAAYLLQTREGTIKQWQALAKIHLITLEPTVVDCIVVRQYVIDEEGEGIRYFFCFSPELSTEMVEARAKTLELDEKYIIRI